MRWDGAAAGVAGTVPAGRLPRRSLAVAACAGAGLLVLGMCCFQLAQPRSLYGVQQYDDGVYFASALQLAAGRVPYKDFTLVQPPGVPLLMVPVAVLAHLIGSRAGMAVARVVTAIVCAADAVLAGWVVRHRGALPAAVAAIVFAIFPADYSADRTLLLEPYLVLFLLAGTALTFDGDTVAGRRRIALAGIAFACAGTTKVWAIFPFAALCLVVAAHSRHGFETLLSWTAGAFAVLCGPFIAAAPRSFVRDVIVAQFARTAQSATPPGQRLAYLDGVLQTTLPVHDPGRLGVEVGAVLASVLVLTLGVPTLARRASPLETFILCATAVSVGIMFVPHTFYSHYAYLPDAFLAVALALAVDRCRLLLRSAMHVDSSRSGRRAFLGLGGLLAAGALAGVGILVPAESGFAEKSLHGVGDPGPAIASVVPAGSCTLADAVSLLVSANRYSTAPGCPAVVDPSGLWIAADPEHPPLVAGPTSDPALIAGWEQRLSQADYFVSIRRMSFRIPWDTTLRAWFAAHYRLVAVDRAFIYKNVHSRAITGGR
jgi:alpha-1,2-mannosyltransferase